MRKPDDLFPNVENLTPTFTGSSFMHLKTPVSPYLDQTFTTTATNKDNTIELC